MLYPVYYVHRSTLYSEEQLKALLEKIPSAVDQMVPVVLQGDILDDERSRHE